MNKLLFLLLTIASVLTTACSDQCSIAGNSTVGSLDGRMLYLRVSCNGQEVMSLDSCEVTHGRFTFSSTLDSTRVAQVCIGNESLMPVVLETGELVVQVDHSGQRVSGGPLNDRLYEFLQRKERIENEQWELDRKCMEMLHSGKSPEEINREIAPKAKKLAKKLEDLETKFIKDNYDNALGPGCFMWLFRQYPFPVMTNQIERIVKDAPPQFLCDPYVSHYLRVARQGR